MRIAMVGSGGVGGYFGGLLARAGHEVIFVARGAHLRALREHGLRVRSVHGAFHLPQVTATDRPAEAGPLVGPQTAVLPLQNGVESAARLTSYFGPQAVLGGAVWVVASVAEPGLIRQENQFPPIFLVELEC